MQQRSHSRGTNSKPSTPRGASMKPSSFQAFMKDKLSLDNVAKYSTRVLEDLKSSSTLAATKDVAAKISTDVASTATKVSSEVNRAIASFSPSNQKSSTSEDHDEKLAQLCEFGFEPTAAQSALKRSGGNLATAAHWLFQERESKKDGDESKNESHKGHVDGGSCSSGVGISSPCSVSSLTKQAASSSSEPSSRRRCPAADDDDDPFRLTSDDLVEAEEEAEHNGFGLGIAARRRSWLSCPAAAASKSPAKPSPAPNAIQEQHPVAGPGPTPIDASTPAETSAAAIQEEDVDRTGEAKDTDSDCSYDSASTGQEKFDATLDVDGAFVPPDSEFWDWPLSREEKKSRVSQHDRIEQDLDMVSMMQELAELRKFKQQQQRRSSAASCSSARTDCTGVSCAGASGASGPTAGADTSPSKRPQDLDDRDQMHADE